jgi:hypothetical protein
MLNCHDATQLCSDEQDRDLTLGERMGLGMHTLMCAGCHNYRKQMKFLRQAAQRYAEGGALDGNAPPAPEEAK